MLISIEELQRMKEFQTIDAKVLERKMKAIEQAVRQVTNNNFQNRLKRIVAISDNNKIEGSCPYFSVGDTIEISESINEGLYTIKEITDQYIEFNELVYGSNHNLLTKIEYPADIVEGAIELLKWDVSSTTQKAKNGIASESLSRHSVSYQSYDTNNTINGYPVALFSFCNKYAKARF